MPIKHYSTVDKAQAVMNFKSEVTKSVHLLTQNPVVSALNSVCDGLLGGGIKHGTLATWILTADLDPRSELAYEIKKLKSSADNINQKLENLQNVQQD